MLLKFTVQNYKNFQNPLTIDFSEVGGYQFSSDCLNENTISKMLIYGKNATGKTNLGMAIIDIAISPFFSSRNIAENFINADSELDSAYFSYIFKFGKDIVEYSYEKYSSAKYKTEKFLINNLEIFNFDYINNIFMYKNLNEIAAETILVERFLQSKTEEDLSNEEIEPALSFLRWLFANAAFSSESLMNELRNFINKMRALSISVAQRNLIRRADPFFETLEGENLKKLETFLNDMGVECQLVTKKLPDGKRELYFKRKKLLPFFENASSGTLILFNIYRRILTTLQNMSFCYFDEFDAFFHYEMSEKFLKYFKENYPKCQIIFTTHNTNLMSNQLMRPDCLFILSSQGTLTPLNKATLRELREGHNLEKMYISGEFKNYE